MNVESLAKAKELLAIVHNFIHLNYFYASEDYPFLAKI